MALDSFKKRLLKQVGLGLGIIIVLVVFMFVLSADINSRTLAIDQAHNELTLRTQTINLLTGSNTDLKKSDQYLANLQQFLPEKDALVDFREAIPRIGKTYAVDAVLGFTRIEKAATADQPGSIGFDLVVGGTFDDIIDFLKYIEAHKYLINIASVDIQISPKDKSRFSLVINGEIYTK